MLQSIRDKTPKWLATTVLVALSVPFAFFGINSYFSARAETWVAKAGKVEISPAEFKERMEIVRRNLRQQRGAAYDASQIENPEFKRKLLEQLVDERLSSAAAESIGASATDAAVREQIEKFEAFQTDGKFDPAVYKMRVNQSYGRTPLAFEQLIAEQLNASAIPGRIGESTFVSDAAVERYLRLRDQTRDFKFVAIPPQNDPTDQPADADLTAYYELHKDEYSIPEQVSLDYVELDAAKMALDVVADEAALKEKYEREKTRFVSPEQRQASHILIKLAPGADAAADKAALDKITALAAEIKAGKSFAEVAKASSEDLGSKAQGGDLGFIEKGSVSGEFEKALFAMAPNTISEPVKSDQGYHLIQLREVRAEQSKPFEAVRADLERDYLDSERERRYNEVAGKLIEEVYRKPSGLIGIAEEMKLPVLHTPPFGREGGPGIAATPAVVKAAFSDQVLVDGNASDRIEIAPNHIVLVKIAEHKPKTPRSLDEVKPLITARVVAERTEKRTRDYAVGLEKRLAEGATLEALATEAKATVQTAAGTGRNAMNQDRELVKEVFRLARPAAADKPTRAMVSIGGKRYVLVELSAVTDGDAAKVEAAQKDSIKRMLQQSWAARDARGFTDSLHDGLEVKIAEERM